MWITTSARARPPLPTLRAPRTGTPPTTTGSTAVAVAPPRTPTSSSWRSRGRGIVLLKNDGALPLASGSEVSLIGRYAADPVYGGAGSGTVDPNDCVTLHDGIAAAGLVVNDTAFNWIAENYASYPKANITMDNPNTATYYIGEIPWGNYSEEARASIAGTTALVVIGRGGGEGGDLSTDLLATLNDGKHANFTANDETANYAEGQHQLELTAEERDLIAAAKQSCDTVVVLYNGSTPLEMAPLMSGELEVDAILSIGSLGGAGATAVGQVLTGVVNPSGRTTDIWPADFTADPTFGNFGGKQYTDVTNYYPHNYNGSVEDATAYFVEYEEGVYFGYRYYETAAEAEAGGYRGFDYDEAVVFPFGYVLSYTSFSQSLDACESDGETVSASVTVTNTGSVAGKCVVELYYSSPVRAGRHREERGGPGRLWQDAASGPRCVRGRGALLPRVRHGVLEPGGGWLRARRGRLCDLPALGLPHRDCRADARSGGGRPTPRTLPRGLRWSRALRTSTSTWPPTARTFRARTLPAPGPPPRRTRRRPSVASRSRSMTTPSTLATSPCPPRARTTACR